MLSTVWPSSCEHQNSSWNVSYNQSFSLFSLGIKHTALLSRSNTLFLLGLSLGRCNLWLAIPGRVLICVPGSNSLVQLPPPQFHIPALRLQLVTGVSCWYQQKLHGCSGLPASMLRLPVSSVESCYICVSGAVSCGSQIHFWVIAGCHLGFKNPGWSIKGNSFCWLP